MLGSWPLSPRASFVLVGIPAAALGCLAGPRWLRLRDHEPDERTVAAILRQGVYLLSAGHLRGGGVHAVAPDQGRQAASAGRRNLIVGGWLGCTSWVVGYSYLGIISGLPSKPRIRDKPCRSGGTLSGFLRHLGRAGTEALCNPIGIRQTTRGK